jgi:hypothetical protein
MQKWKYKIGTLRFDQIKGEFYLLFDNGEESARGKNLTEVINTLGKKGWELFIILCIGETLHYHFKRAI